MAKKPKVTGQVTPPDFDHAKKIWDQDIRPARTRQKAAMKDQKEGWDEAKAEAHINKPGFATACKVKEMEEADQQSWLRSFFGGLKAFGIGLHADMMDKASDAEEDGDGFVAPPVVKPSTMDAPALN